MNHEYTQKFLALYWAKVDKNGPVPSHCPELGPCWMWIAGTNSEKYGQIGWDGQMRNAHRIGYEIAYGPIPDRLLACHHCDNPSCVNPSHIFLGTNLDNVRDREKKGRGKITPCPKEKKAKKLTDEQVTEIRRLYAVGDTTHRELGKLFNVTHGHISHLVNHKSR